MFYIISWLCVGLVCAMTEYLIWGNEPYRKEHPFIVWIIVFIIVILAWPIFVVDRLIDTYLSYKNRI